jgi:hypothetical protein
MFVVRNHITQALMLPFVRTQDDDSNEVAYYFSPDMIIEVNTMRGMRVLAYVLFDTLVQHVQYLQQNKRAAADRGDEADISAVATDSVTFAQWNACFDDRDQARKARRAIFTPQQQAKWRENKKDRAIRRQDLVQA